MSRGEPRRGVSPQRVFGGLALTVLGLSATLVVAGDASFSRFFGDVPPLLVVVVCVGGALLALRYLELAGWLRLYRHSAHPRRWPLVLGLASTMTAVAIVLDLVGRFPEDTNVPVPVALAFYPAIAFVVEALFHVLPLAVLLGALAPLRGRVTRSTLLGVSLGITATLEPLYQVRLAAAGSAPSLFEWTTGLHILAFNLIQMELFRRYDFVTVYAFRVMYYGLWHIGWGVLRLHLLF
ncbi:MAG: hypothetical protein R3E10_19505 [Gemmatimonadota bacterium]